MRCEVFLGGGHPSIFASLKRDVISTYTGILSATLGADLPRKHFWKGSCARMAMHWWSSTITAAGGRTDPLKMSRLIWNPDSRAPVGMGGVLSSS